MIMGKFQSLSRALMGAVAVMPVAALLMGIGYWIDPTGWGTNSIIAAVLITSGKAVLDNLGLIFAIAIAFGLSKDKNGAAALSGLVGFMTLTSVLAPTSIAAYRGIEDPKELTGDTALSWASQGWDQIGNSNVLFGILVGLLAAWAYNTFHSVKLPDALAFFSGRRLVPIVTALLCIALSGVMYFLWPMLYGVMFHFGQTVQGMGPLGAGIYGTANRLLIPTGLHHALNSIFWFDVVNINDIGKFLAGGATIEAAKSATDAASCPGIWENGQCTVEGVVGRYQAGFFPVMMFGMPGAALAMYLRADTRRKKVTGSLMLAGAIASFATGVTEPLEFAFMFAAPPLYLVHALLTGLSVFLAAQFGWTAGFGFSAGGIDLLLASRNPLAHDWWMLLVLGLVYFFLYLGLFYVLIGAFNLRTPGRGADDPVAEGAVAGSVAAGTNDADQTEDAGGDRPQDGTATIISGLGGAENITSLEHCATRLRVKVADDSEVSEETLKRAPIAGVMRPTARSVQVVIGPQVQFVYDDVARALDAERSNIGR
ncbi:N-acetylglucosamine-specific PTS transporter subunit IIBC [Rothia sp. LK2588]|uniref:N-acetylglucosamine-specific PTS transporter subunit IIBC n=1 Tax=Rothia sp. LK2588 TaxID=3114369 RepID=UPI0034CD260E